MNAYSRCFRLIFTATSILALTSAAYAQARDEDIEPRQMGVISLFIERHEWFLGLEVGPAGAAYGLGPAETQKLSGFVRSAKVQLDQLQTEAPSLKAVGAQRDYFERRRAILAEVVRRMQLELTPSSWQAVSAYINETIASRLVSVPVVYESADSATGKLVQEGNPAGSSGVDWLHSWSEINFYNDGMGTYGLGGREDSWVEGPNALSYCSTVDLVKGSLNGTVFDGPRSATACNGGRAWAGFTRPSPYRGTYKIEGFHRFSQSGQMVAPPFTGWIGPTSGPNWYFQIVDGYDRYETPVDFGLQVAAPQEVNKPGHHLIMKNCPSPVVVTAVFTPPVGNAWPPVNWTGGMTGSDNLHRNVACTSPGTTQVTAAVGANLSASVMLHVVDAAAPGPTGQASISAHYAGFVQPPPGALGLTAFTIGSNGITAPRYVVTPGFAGDRWVFRLASVDHDYKTGIVAAGLTDLPQGNIRPFPINGALPPGTTIVQAHAEARADLDTSGLVPRAPQYCQSGSDPRTCNFVPRLQYYYVYSAVQAHEQAHVTRFYSPIFSFWHKQMRDFETTDIEDPSVSVIYDCTDPSTHGGSAVVDGMKPTWDAVIAARHDTADILEGINNHMDSEAYAFSTTNPLFDPIFNAIPTGAAPVINAIRDYFTGTATAAQGTSGYVEIYGANLDAAPVIKSITPANSGLSLSFTYISSGQLNAYYTVTASAPLGARTITIETDNGESSVMFTIVGQ